MTKEMYEYLHEIIFGHASRTRGAGNPSNV